MDVHELDFELPAELIAQAPLSERDQARLMVLDRASGVIEHRTILSLPELLAPSLLVVNDSRVIPARLLATKASGGRIELLLIERLESSSSSDEVWRAMARGRKSLREGTALRIAERFEARIERFEGDGVLVRLLVESGDIASALEEHGHVPLPPYITRLDTASDRDRYQTVFARHAGSVAAPTAGLHFSPRLLQELEARGHLVERVTLHVGPGTFMPLRSDSLEEHVMHEERWSVPLRTAEAILRARSEGRRVVAIGTTVARTLEAAYADGVVRAGEGRTRIFIHPPMKVRAFDSLLTNFHLPRSTLLALVMSVGGIEGVREAYRIAVEERYRFFSYGDAMLVR